MKLCLGAIAAAFVVLISTPCLAADFVWWEAESPVKTNFPANAWPGENYLAERADQLSGGKWLATNGNAGDTPLFADYSVAIPRTGKYNFWVRKFYSFGEFRWRFDDQPWAVCDKSAPLLDSVNLAKFVDADWVPLGKTDLAQGDHKFRFELLAKKGESTTCGFDCFVLTPGPFVPNGKLKPGERSGKADPGYFAFEPDLDPFTESPVDLRYLNESAAGIHGPVKRAGDHIATGDGKPIRFWAVNVGLNNIGQDHDTVDYMAAKLARLGVNLVRFHDRLYDSNGVNGKSLDRLQYMVAALGKQGIYTDLSLYYPLWVGADNIGRPGYDTIQNKHPFGTLYFDPAVQEQWTKWVTGILSPVSPYSGKSLAADPAIAVVEVVNEDSLLFWTFDHKNIPDPAWKLLESDFTKWAGDRYGSIARARSTWGGLGQPGDSESHLTLAEAWGMTTGGGATLGKARASDQRRFLAETQRGWYARAAKIYHDLGYRGLVNSTNWFTADSPLSDAVERWTYSADDVTDQHGYFEPPVTGPGSGYAVGPGHVFTARAAVLEPGNVPIRSVRTAGHPTTISELGWTNPNPYRADATFLAAAYGSLQGTDGMDFFILGSDFLLDHAMTKFAVAGPVASGSFPAAALVYRRGDIAIGKPVFDKTVDLDKALQSGAPVFGHGIDDFACYVGPVVRRFDGTPALTVDPQPFIDRTRKTIASDTGQLRWDYGTGVATVDTPLAAGATGFLGKHGPIALGDLTIDCRDEFAAVWFVSLDGIPLKSSKKILVQTTTREQPFGFKTRPTDKGLEITDIGSGLMEVEKIDLTITLATPATVRPLDENGYPTGQPSAPAKSIKVSPDTIAVLLTR